jgi:glycosyltransferase involved in cell wall biosynthesis
MSAYDVEHVLPQTLDSLLSQTYGNFELVLLDNGSTDSTAEVIRGFDDARIRAVAVAPNMGGYQGMNHAISLARGELIAVYHSDDIYDPRIVEREVEFLVRDSAAGAVFTMDHYMDDDGVVFGGTSLPAEFRGGDSLTYEQIFRYILRRKNTLLRCPTFMTRASVLAEVGVFEPEKWDIASDTELWLRLSRSFPIGILEDRLVFYRVRRDNWSARYEKLRTEEERHFAVMDHYLGLDGARGGAASDDLREYAFHRCDDETIRAANHVILGELDAARRLLQQPYSATIFLAGFRRRKLRVLLLRGAMRVALAVRAPRMLSRLLIVVQYKGRLA